MLTLSWADVNQPLFGHTLMKLNNIDKLEPRTAYRVGRIVETCKKEMEKAKKLEDHLKKEFLKVDEKGELILDEEKNPQWKDDEAVKLYAHKIETTFKEHKFDIKVHKLNFESLHGLSGQEFISIESIVDGIPEEV